MSDREEKKTKPSVRQRASAIKAFRSKNLIVVLEDPAQIRNIGTVIRNVNAFGAEKLYVIDPHGKLPDDWEDARKRKSLQKSSVSAVQWTFVKRFDSTEACITHLKKLGFKSIATSPHQKDKPSFYLHEPDFTKTSRLAVWFGNEGRGLTDKAIDHAEYCIAIPMFGIIESFNLGTSSGIVLYEITKQRRAYQARFKGPGRRKRRKTPLATEMPIGESFGQKSE